MRRHITQAEARRTREKLTRLQTQVEHFGVRVDTLNVTNTELMIAETARQLGFTLVARPLTGNQIAIYAVKVTA